MHRRDFLKNTALAGVGFWAAAGVRADERKSANEKLNIAIIGAGGQGASNLRNISRLGHNIVALCDVDEARAAKAFAKFTAAKKYHDFRELLEKQKDIDAVVVSTPDHMHAPASVMAMKLGKHVYCEKPLTHDIYEARVMRETAARCKVATQMGNMGTASSGFRHAVEFIQAGNIGPVQEVHVWTNRPGTYWRQGLDRPKDTPTVPATLSWDLWLGTAPVRPYHPTYVPHNWRGWWDFGTGALGDMACHTMNLPFMALKLGSPTAVTAESSGTNFDSYAIWSVIRYEFPARGELPPVKLTWYDGGKMSPTELLKGQKMTTSGSLFVGDKATLYSPDDYGTRCYVLHEKEMEQVQGMPEKLPRSPGHHEEWINACKGGKPALANFDYAGPLTEVVLLGNLAVRAGRRIEWDGQAMRAPNWPESEQYVRRQYRNGWSL
jgi:predicted dehydrogenase